MWVRHKRRPKTKPTKIKGLKMIEIEKYFGADLRGRDTNFSTKNAKKIVQRFARGNSVSEHTLRECLRVLFPETNVQIIDSVSNTTAAGSVKNESRYSRITRFLENKKKATDLEVYKEFGMTFPEVRRELKNTGYLITYSTVPHPWNPAMKMYIYHFHGMAYKLENWVCPEGHKRIQ